MGLDATVYRNANAFQKSHGTHAFDIDTETGEVTPKPGIHFDSPKPSFIAITHRIGNFDKVGAIRAKLLQILNKDESILLKKVLYSATHAGDIVKSADFDKIIQEISVVRKAANDPLVSHFVDQIEELINVALAEGNPIVFV